MKFLQGSITVGQKIHDQSKSLSVRVTVSEDLLSKRRRPRENRREGLSTMTQYLLNPGSSSMRGRRPANHPVVRIETATQEKGMRLLAGLQHAEEP